MHHLGTNMDWVLRSPQIHSTFSNLGCVKNDGYHVNENCNSALETILSNILSEDKYLRAYRRSLSHGNNVQKDLIPLFIHAKEDKTVELLIQILVNITIPIECLLNVDLISRTDYGRYTVFDINNLLATAKVAFTDLRVSKALFDFLKKNSEVELKENLSEQQRTNVSNCLLLLRNILHIPEDNGYLPQTYGPSTHSVQNQILWNIFSQSVDKIIIKFMTILDAGSWGVTMVQLVALLYKDQHIVSIQKLLNNWLEAASSSESSEDNESNTTPPDRAGSEDSSAMLTSSDSTSDSCDNSGGDKSGETKAAGNETATQEKPESVPAPDTPDQTLQLITCEQGNIDETKSAESIPDTQDIIPLPLSETQDINTNDEEPSQLISTTEQTKLNNDTNTTLVVPSDQNISQKQVIVSEVSDCGYGTHVENRASISTSSNEDDVPAKKKHKKPLNAKQRPNNKRRPSTNSQDRKRRKVVKRGKANIINVQGLSHKTPTDEDITNVIKEFTVDFLLKGYNSLVRTLHSEIIANPMLEIDTSHFFWLLSYFLKFASQIELDLEHIGSVLSYEIVLYLTSEGVSLCEQFEVAIKLDGIDLEPNLRRQHLVVTAIREFIQTVELYKKSTRLNKDGYENLAKLQIKICETEDLRSMFVLLLRHFNPKYHSKQYLQDLIVTNHMVLMFLDKGMKLPEYNSTSNLVDHLRQFATTEIMAQYGMLLNDYLVNGEYVNNCIFTLMHHVGGELDSLITLFQPNILKTFTAIWKSDFEICDDWTDLIEYVINTFVKKPFSLNIALLFPEEDNSEESKMFDNQIEISSFSNYDVNHDAQSVESNKIETPMESRWTEDEISALRWYYLQNNDSIDIISQTKAQFEEDGIEKSREAIIRELFNQSLISRDFYENQLKGEIYLNANVMHFNEENVDEEITKICEHLIEDGKAAGLIWVQEAILEMCFAKIHIHKINVQKAMPLSLTDPAKDPVNEEAKIKIDEWPVMSPVAYHSLIKNQSVPLVAWNCQQSRICNDLKFLQLLHKLGFNLPVDTGKIFIRIPHFWTPDCLFNIAGKIRPIDTTKLKFHVSDLTDSAHATKLDNIYLPSGIIEEVPFIGRHDSVYQIHEQNVATMVNYTPRPGLSFKKQVETPEYSWLEFVQKSQNRKIVLNMDSINTSEDVDMELPDGDVKMS